MAEIAITILGFDRIGASLARALNRYNAKGGTHHFTITGYDLRPDVAKQAEKLKLVDHMANRPRGAVSDKDMVVMALPYAEVRATYERISGDLRPGAVVIDMSPLKQPSQEWAKKYLPEEAHLVGATPVINPAYLFEPMDDIDHAHEDLFDGGTMLLMPSASCIKEAVELAVDFSRLLGAKTHFVDPVEHDGLIAATEGLPSLLGIALFHMLYHSEGWTDGQRMINPAFGALTTPMFGAHPDDIRDSWMNNRENLLRYLDQMMETLRGFRAALAQNDRMAVEATIIETSDAYEKWYNRRRKSRWDDDQQSKIPGALDTISRGLMGGYVTDKLSGNKDDE